MRVPQISQIPTDFFDLCGRIKGTQMAQMAQILTCSVWDFADFGYFADNLQNFCFFLGGLEKKA